MSKHYTIQTKQIIELLCSTIILAQHIKALREGKKNYSISPKS
jgi:hypothetical protein